MPALRDIVIVLDSSARSDARLDIAIALAQLHHAHLTGVSALSLLTPERLFEPSRGSPALEPHMMRSWGATVPIAYPPAAGRAAETAEQMEDSFHNRLRFAGLPGDWRMADGKVGETVVSLARNADLIILGQPDADHAPPPAGRQLLEDVLMTAGRPVLIVPYIGRFDTVGTRIIIGWNNSREATRAVNDAMPLLAQAESVIILEAVPPGRKAPAHEANGTGMVHHLAHHGISAKTVRMVMDGISAPDAMLSYAADSSADLLVVGGYGHSRLRKLILGGATHALLHHMTVPVLMSH